MPQSQVTSLTEDGHDYLWAGTQGGGVARFDGKEFRTYSIADGLPDNFIEQLGYDPDGTIYAQTRRGMAKLRLGAEKWEASDAAPIGDPKPTWWAKVTTGLPQPVAAVKLTPDRYLVGTQSSGLYLLDLDGAIITHYTETNSNLPRDNIRALLNDRQGRTWVATSGGGIARMIPTGLRHFDRDDGLIGERVYALHQANDQLWIGASQRGMQYLDSTGFHQPPVADPTRGAKITSIQRDTSGRVYFATDGRGIAVLDDSMRVEVLTRRAGLGSNWIVDLLPAERGNGLWAVSYAEGISRVQWQDSSFKVENYVLSDLPPNPQFLTAINYPGDGMLLGTRAGQIVQWLPAGIVATLGPANGLPEAPIKALALRRNTQLWAAVTGYGLYYTDLRSSNPVFAP
ncbi:MAG: two-component regulator propeller domain-containing protein, partial [Bacteroidota bacterium]